MSGTAGRTNYADWNKKTNALLTELDKEEKEAILESKAALGQDGKYAYSETEAKERAKLEQASQVKAKLDEYKQRELGVVQVLASLLEDQVDENGQDPKTRFITCADLDAGKRVLHLTNTTARGHIILTQDLSNLESNVPSSALTPKSYPNDAENTAPQFQPGSATIRGLIKASISNVNDCTISIKCKVITGLLEVSHCRNLTIRLCDSSTIVTIQADLCQNLTVEFHDAPSGKGISSRTNPASTAQYWGDDDDDRIFHAGVENLVVRTYRNGVLDLETFADYQKDGAKAVGNATAEEVQFITSVVEGSLMTERVLRQGSATGTTVAGAVGGGDVSGGARAMTAREMKAIEMRKKQIQKAVDERLGNGVGGIKIVDKDGNEVQKKVSNEEEKIEELYAGMPNSDIHTIVQDCEAQKAKGNEAFVAGEYAQAVLLYTLALDRAAELPDASNDDNDDKKQLFPRQVVLSNRSASFLKLGHHDKALADATEAERLDPTYVKGVFRKGLALHAMGRYQEAITPLAAALKIEPKNKQIKQALQFAEVRMHQEMRKRMAG